MKKLMTLFTALAATMCLVFVSCSKDNDSDPSTLPTDEEILLKADPFTVQCDEGVTLEVNEVLKEYFENKLAGFATCKISVKSGYFYITTTASKLEYVKTILSERVEATVIDKALNEIDGVQSVSFQFTYGSDDLLKYTYSNTQG